MPGRAGAGRLAALHFSISSHPSGSSMVSQAADKPGFPIDAGTYTKLEGELFDP